MDEATAAPMGRKTYTYTRQPTPAQQGTLALVVRRCRALDSAGLHARRAAWQQCGVRTTAARQSAHLPAIKDVRPDSHEVHAQVLQDVLTRLDRAFQACFHRVQAGETPGSPRVHGATRSHSFTDQQLGNRATLDNGFLVLSQIGRSAGRWSRPL